MRVTCSHRAANSTAVQLREWLEKTVYRHHDRKRRHIVNPELSNLVLQRLQHTLPAPGTCDVIDVNPGICVWSKEINRVLKPRRHILVEPDKKLYRDCLEPLLKKDSSYRHTFDIRTALDPAEKLLSAETIKDDVERVTDRDERFEKRSASTNQLIVFANLSGHADARLGFVGGKAKQFLEDYARSMIGSSRQILFHRYGLVRLIAWVNEDDKYAINPRSVVGRTRQAIRLEASSSMSEVASSIPYDGVPPRYHRWHNLDIQNSNEIASLPQMDDVLLPIDRVQPHPYPPSYTLPAERVNFEVMLRNPTRPKLIDELVEINEKLRKTDPDYWLRAWTTEPKSRISHDQPDRRLWLTLMARLKTKHRAYKKVEQLIGSRRASESQMAALDQDHLETSDHMSRFEALSRDLDAITSRIQNLLKDDRVLAEKALDDYRAYNSEPKVMSWNQRDCEPVLTKPEDFYPEKAMTLVDFVPKPEIVSLLDTTDKQICFDYVVATMSTNSAQSASDTLKRLIPGGLDDFLKTVPTLRDSSKGGWYNLDQVRFRSFPTALLMDLALAFERWPFRPSTEQLMSFTSNSGMRPRKRLH